ncbi:hypothetical protein GPECTOR_20g554 [Gonium pectorale]|uniref:Pseudouridine synthase I TruA alpha/beta domain-containing protein n=1 Tax=Gonium pectorale TaxID=33097 RepID=A0A150GIR5_GONPE|nr:hypothetical protein GPECTOR_20g554 [Gonium pectorale]|eukprot:KXZ49697.1 hypothetical protein GPECTOR_20g554 [Gonium pectorale]
MLVPMSKWDHASIGAGATPLASAPCRRTTLPGSRASTIAAAAPRGARRSGAEDEEGEDGAARPATARRLKMTVAYDGSEFAGFQFQPGKVRTVQGELERCAKRLFLGCSRMVGASRTDGGAHAHGQVVHFDVYGDRDNLESDALYYNSFLPPDVRVLGLSYAEDGFDSHFSSCGKTYTYKFAAGLPDPLQAGTKGGKGRGREARGSRYAWWVYDRWCERSRGKPGRLSDVSLDVGAMAEAAEGLLGRHDFSAFMDSKRPAGRILTHLRLRESVSPVSGGQEVVMEVTGNGFLYRMVRMLAAGLVEVGHRRLSPAGLAQLLARADRSALPEAAPPHGLYLSAVHYPGDPVWESRIQDLAARIRAGSGPAARSGAGYGAGGGGGGGSGVVLGGRGISEGVGDGKGQIEVGPGGVSRFTLPAEAVAEAAVAEVAAGGPEDEAAVLVRELRQSQGQKAAALMRAAAAARRSSAAAAGEDGGGGGSDGDGGGTVAGPGLAEEGGGGAAAAGWGEEEAGDFAAIDFSTLRDRDEDQ